MGEYNRKKFRQIMVDAELYDRLSSLKWAGDTFADVIRRLLEPMKRPPAGVRRRNKSMAELMALARVAKARWDRDIASGRVKLLGPGPVEPEAKGGPAPKPRSPRRRRGSPRP